MDNGDSKSAVSTPQLVHDSIDDVDERGSDEVDPALGPLERLQRKWGIGDRKTRGADGAPAKRRGPKPDSKPAMTRRQELNRQAQRTHRERKENYMRELEITVDRLKKTYEIDVERVREENKKLKALLAAHSIPHEFNSPQHSYTSPSSIIGATSIGSVYGTHSGFTSPTNANMPVMSMAAPSPSYQQQHHPTSGSLPVPRNNIHGLDYDDVGIDFVGQLEQNCSSHQQYMTNRSLTDEDWVSGHALMATAPPRQHCEDHGMDVEYPHKMPNLPKPDLARMLALSTSLPGLREELTPVMAYSFILSHPACPDMTKKDFEAIRDDLKPKVACYGFGAVLENFEVEDAVHRVLSAKIMSQSTATDMEWSMVMRSSQPQTDA